VGGSRDGIMVEGGWKRRRGPDTQLDVRGDGDRVRKIMETLKDILDEVLWDSYSCAWTQFRSRKKGKKYGVYFVPFGTVTWHENRECDLSRAEMASHYEIDIANQQD
jgi:hypothetical protein